jgi:L-ascorbate metabolism protein UlaG (beta-lactamase superfamily)
MMKQIAFLMLLASLCLSSCNSHNKTETTPIHITPIHHGSLIIEYDQEVIYIDPIGDADIFKDQKAPTLILITDIHSDHFSNETLKAIAQPESQIILPKAVRDRMKEVPSGTIHVLENNTQTTINTILVEAIPMYNLRPEAQAFHPKGRGNSYILNLGTQRVYISGDTEATSEVRGLVDIDIAFICMSMPWSMSVENAASAVLEFAPKVVYPYRYKGADGLSDIKQFKTLINKGNSSIKVHLKDWY